MKLSNLITTGARQVDTVAGGLEAIVLALTSRAAGWIACIPTILLTARSCEVIFALAPMEALASAVALELVGQSTVKTWLRAREWNRTKRGSDAPANASLALLSTIGYFATDFALIAILQIPKAKVEPVYYAALLFPLAQVISTVTTAERAAQFGREAEAVEDREKKREAMVLGKMRAAEKRERAQAKRERLALELARAEIEKAQISVAIAAPTFTNRQLAQIKRIVAVYAANETATLRDLQTDDLIGSATTASRARQRAIAGGYLVATVQGFSPNGGSNLHKEPDHGIMSLSD